LSGFFCCHTTVSREFIIRKIGIIVGALRPLFQKNHNLSTAIFGFSKNGGKAGVIAMLISVLQQF
jgi:hypothetical protein